MTTIAITVGSGQGAAIARRCGSGETALISERNTGTILELTGATTTATTAFSASPSRTETHKESTHEPHPHHRVH